MKMRQIPLLALICVVVAVQSGSVSASSAPVLTPVYNSVDDLLNLDPEKVRVASVSAVVSEMNSSVPLLWKYADNVMPIASITKLMSAMVLLDGGQALDEKLLISRQGFHSAKSVYSRIRPGSRISRRELLRLSLMSSENLATYVLAVNFPGGLEAFVGAMNNKARELNMLNSSFKDPTGLNAGNQSTASDLLFMVRAAMKYPLILEYSTTSEHIASFSSPRYRLKYRNTNPLVRKGDWDIALSKTGYINEAGRCLVMLTEISGFKVAMVLLDSFGKRTPVGDAARIKRWLTTGKGGKVSKTALQYEKKKRLVYNLGERVVGRNI